MGFMHERNPRWISLTKRLSIATISATVRRNREKAELAFQGKYFEIGERTNAEQKKLK